MLSLADPVHRCAWLGSLALLGLLAPARADAQLRSLAGAPPGSAVQAEAAALARGKAKERSEITFVGYRALEGGRGVVFVELTETVAVELNRAGQVLEFRLVGARVPLKNNRNPLLLRDFGSIATSAVLVPDKSAVRLVITLREAVTPQHRIIPRGEGFALEIELPAPPPR